ncbi:MAG TPA: polysaccharide deacetylase family protein [Myxococcota bacterium]|nr:polysaccharide deacetylase family protein [Myxococcota bacterium]HQK52412.1 polysaccharide deacetylase family protein [Myxococcota bacterium]
MTPPADLCLSIDLDDLRHYRAIHALPPGPAGEDDRLFERAVPRFLQFAEDLGIPTTLFVIAEDLQRVEGALEALREAVSRGHEIASHSLTHRYDLSRQPREVMAREVREARSRIQEALGVEARGFRGPGYNLTPALLREVAAAGHAWDSSILPAPMYWAARASVVAWMALRGRPSRSITGRARDFLARPRTPFRWPEEAGGVWEIPMTAAGWLRLPLIGTNLALGGFLARHPWNGARNLPFVHIEFHGLDFLDIREDALDPDLGIEPVLRVPLEERTARFREFVAPLVASRRGLLLSQVPSSAAPP